jgi:hypothetical protein
LRRPADERQFPSPAQALTQVIGPGDSSVRQRCTDPSSRRPTVPA